MINWLLKEIETAQDKAEAWAEKKEYVTSVYERGRVDAFKECLKFIEDASRKEKENE